MIHEESADMWRFWPVTTMTHANELAEWLVNTLVSRFNVRVAQLWKYQLQHHLPKEPELLALSLTDLSVPKNVLVNPNVAELVKLMIGPQNRIAPQPVQNLFPDYLTILLRRRGLTYCAGYCVGKDLDLPLEKSYEFARSKLMLLLFLDDPFRESLTEIPFFLEQALVTAEKRGLLRIQSTVQWDNNVLSMASSLPLETLVPRRVSGSLIYSLITDRNARRLYEAIDDHSSVSELVVKTHLNMTEAVKAFQLLLNQQYIQLYEPEKARELEEQQAAPVSEAVEAYNKAREFFEGKQYTEALKAYEQAIELEPHYVEAYNGKGDTLLQLRRGAEAEEAYKQAVLRSIKRIR